MILVTDPIGSSLLFNRIMFKIKDRILSLAKQQDLPPKSATLAKRFFKYGDAMFKFLFDPSPLIDSLLAISTIHDVINGP